MRYTLRLATAALTLTLAACGGKDAPVLPADTVGLRITSEVPAGIKADRITVIPNDVAPWLSQILLLSDGNLYRTAANGGKAQGVNGGDLQDMIGLMRKGEAGTALTLTQDGKLTALIEKDDEGRLARMNVSAKANSYDGFCQSNKAPAKTVMAFSGKNLVTLEIGYNGNELMTVTEKGRQAYAKAISSCHLSGEKLYVISNGQLYADSKETGYLQGETDSLTGLSGAAAPALLYVENGKTLSTLRAAMANKRRNILIQDGLSVIGTENISSVFATEDSLGGTFSGGAVIAQDANSDRLVLISLPFARSTLAKQAAKR